MATAVAAKNAEKHGHEVMINGALAKWEIELLYGSEDTCLKCFKSDPIDLQLPCVGQRTNGRRN